MSNDQKSSLADHLTELRGSLIRILAGLIVGVIVSSIFGQKALIFLTAPVGGVEKLQAIEVTESLGVFMRVALLGGFLISLPWTFWQLFDFVGKGLKINEKKSVLLGIPFAVLFFLAGAAFAYYVMLPASMRFFMGFLGIQTILRLKSYFSFTINLIFWTGICFELPLLAFILARVGIINAGMLLKAWRVAIVVMAVLAAVITPTGDPINMLIFMIPLFVLYLLGIGLAALAGKQRKDMQNSPEKQE